MTSSRLLAAVILALLAVGAAGCNTSDLATVGGPSQDSPNPDDGIDPNDPHNGDDTADPQTVPSVDDADGDGIPNADDLIPCMAFYVKIWNKEVSSAEVNLNTQNIVESSFFPTDEILVEFINPAPGINYIDFGGKVAGSPQDELHTEIWDTAGALYLHETVVRGNGQPEEVSLSFDINVTC